MADAQATPTAPALVYDIKMTCGGCSGAINRVLTKNVQAPNHFLVSLEKQKAIIWGGGESLPDLPELTEKVKKTGKEIRKAEKVEGQGEVDAFWQ